MSDPLTWSPIRLGRWFGTTVKVHIFLILFVVIELLMALLATKAEDGLRRLPQTACWLVAAAAGPGDPRAGARPDAPTGWTATRRTSTSGRWQPGRAVGLAALRASISWSPWPGRSPAVPCSWASPSGLNLFTGAQVRLEPVRQPRQTPAPHPGWPTATAGRAADARSGSSAGSAISTTSCSSSTCCRPCRSTAGGCSGPTSRAPRWSRPGTTSTPPGRPGRTAAILFLTGLVRLFVQGAVPTGSR